MILSTNINISIYISGVCTLLTLPSQTTHYTDRLICVSVYTLNKISRNNIVSYNHGEYSVNKNLCFSPPGRAREFLTVFVAIRVEPSPFSRRFSTLTRRIDMQNDTGIITLIMKSVFSSPLIHPRSFLPPPPLFQLPDSLVAWWLLSDHEIQGQAER